MKNPVNAVADRYLLFRWLDMDVRGVLKDRVAHQGVHDLDDRQIFGELLQILRSRARISLSAHDLDRFTLLAKNLAELGLERLLVLAEGRGDRVGGREARTDF